MIGALIIIMLVCLQILIMLKKNSPMRQSFRNVRYALLSVVLLLFFAFSFIFLTNTGFKNRALNMLGCW